MILNSVHAALGDQAQDIVRSAADTVLETLKNEGMKDFDKKREVEDILGPVTSELFSQLVTLSKKITDYNAEDETMGDPDMERKDAEIDDEVGVAVVFDEEEQDDEDEEGFEIREDSDEDKDDAPEAPPADEEDDELVIGGPSQVKASRADQDIVSPHSIDGFWVQRQIAEIYPDPVTAADKTAAVLSILGSESSLRDCENQLMELFEYQSFHITTKFLKNRDVVVWCTKLMRSNADERVDFRWDEKIHGTAETFHILVEDVDGEIILFHDTFILCQKYAEDEHNVTITVPMFEPVPLNYYISIISDHWLHSETHLPISFKHLILPEKFLPPTPLSAQSPSPPALSAAQ